MNKKAIAGELLAVIIGVAIIIIVGGGTLLFGDQLLNYFSYLWEFKSPSKPLSENGLIRAELMHPKSVIVNDRYYYLYSIGPLQYHTGTKWINFPEGKKFKFNDKEMDPNLVREGVARFYFFTERKGSDVFDYSDAIYLKPVYYQSPISPRSIFDFLGYLNLDGEKKPGAIVGEVPAIRVTFNGKFSDGRGREVRELDATEKEEIIAWRDQILEGRDCEKFISIDGNNYRVKLLRNVGIYLVVDLYDAAIEEEPYLECSEASEINFVNNAQFRISFDNFIGVQGLYWGIPQRVVVQPGLGKDVNKGWYVMDNDGDYVFATHYDSDFKMSEAEQQDFLLGLEKIAPIFDRTFPRRDYSNVVVYSIRNAAEAEIYRPGDGQIDSGKDREQFKDILINNYNSAFEKVFVES